MSNEGDQQNGKEAAVDLTSGEWSDPQSGNRVVATEKEGFLCHIAMHARIELEPRDVFRIFSNPDNSHIFRDIDSVPYRKVLERDEVGRQRVEVEQASGFQFLVFPLTFRTRLFVEQDPEALTIRFKLARQGTLKQFTGQWTLTPAPDSGESCEERAKGTVVQLEQDVMPAFVPWLCGGIMRGIAVNAVKRLLEDLEAVVYRVKNGEALTQILANSKKDVNKTAGEGDVTMNGAIAADENPLKSVEGFPIGGEPAFVSEEDI